MDKESFDREKMKESFKEEIGFIPPGVMTGEVLGEDFQKIISDYHHIVWRDEVIPLKYKYLIAISSAVFGDHEARAKLELQKAIKYGATKEEIIEVLRQVVWLRGAPTLVKIAPILSFMDKLLKNKSKE
ncbi:carboxymuconolactone decarboxylase family protein [Selenihalanaerobacter shriftii]|uniref:4-carboxymuconolactone decarboxylase n=1 Tax=Selenihalanaerobacter shriftii TaxID=142842 RepID=A0A1T4JJU8_9FIRM|nr:carboxymuconolactone decarboxylase family protein [Selenihalanaerobacter shriftii]SJZ30460.1 4-carboxymuconolactone decarboxylase [Selenihalanaerobacter shriftii]